MDLKRWKVFRKLDHSFAADVKRAYLIGIDSSRVLINKNNDAPSNYVCKGCVLVMENGDVYCIVSHPIFTGLLRVNQHKSKDLLAFVPVKIDELCGYEIQAVSSGAEHVIALTTDGRIYQWGKLCCNSGWKILKPRFLSGNLYRKKVTQVDCGELHTVALTEEGHVYSWGYNAFGSLGTASLFSQENPVKISGSNGFDVKIVSVACGGLSSFALDSDGNVWSWGNHKFGALGYISSEDQLIPRRISLGSIKKIVAGNTHVLCLSNAKEAYFWGHNETDKTRIVTPKKIEVENVVDVGAIRGCNISAFQTAEGKVYFWGFANGHAIPDPVATKFTSMAELFLSLDTPMMLEPVEIDQKQPTLEKLEQGFDDKATGDVKFVADGKFIYAHKTVLKLCSNYFKGLFDNNWKENHGSGNVLEISEFTYEDFRTFLFYLYTGRIEPPLRTAERAIELFKLADYYGEGDLKRRCERQLEILLTVENSSAAYSVAVQYDAEDLHDSVMDFIIAHFNNIVKTEEYQSMADELQKRLIQEMAAENAFERLKRRTKK